MRSPPHERLNRPGDLGLYFDPYRIDGMYRVVSSSGQHRSKLTPTIAVSRAVLGQSRRGHTRTSVTHASPAPPSQLTRTASCQESSPGKTLNRHVSVLSCSSASRKPGSAVVQAAAKAVMHCWSCESIVDVWGSSTLGASSWSTTLSSASSAVASCGRLRPDLRPQSMNSLPALFRPSSVSSSCRTQTASTALTSALQSASAFSRRVVCELDVDLNSARTPLSPGFSVKTGRIPLRFRHSPRSVRASSSSEPLTYLSTSALRSKVLRFSSTPLPESASAGPVSKLSLNEEHARSMPQEASASIADASRHLCQSPRRRHRMFFVTR